MRSFNLCRVLLPVLGLAACGGGGTPGTEGESESESEAEAEGQESEAEGAEAESESESEAESDCEPDICDDGIDCTDDRCNEQECEHIPLLARCPLGSVCIPGVCTGGCCAPNTCANVSDCPDPGDPCIVIACDEPSATCRYSPLDRDGDGHAPQVCESVDGDDCDDTPTCDPYEDEDCDGDDRYGGSRDYPGADELCDGRDNNCNGEIDDLPELSMPCDGRDGDECEEGVWECNLDSSSDGDYYELECSDETGNSRESCNGLDDDCDGEVDEWLGSTASECGIGACVRIVTDCVAGRP